MLRKKLQLLSIAIATLSSLNSSVSAIGKPECCLSPIKAWKQCECDNQSPQLKEACENKCEEDFANSIVQKCPHPIECLEYNDWKSLKFLNRALTAASKPQVSWPKHG